MNKKSLIILCTITALIALTQVIAYASEIELHGKNIGVTVVQERETEDGFEATLIPEK